MGSGLSSSYNKFLSSTLLLKETKENKKYQQTIQRLLSSYCPNLVLNFLNDKALISPISLSLKGACLLSDICGFTKFSGDLCCEGVTGIDKLRRTTSSFLTKFIDTVYFHYGDGKSLDCFLASLID